ncbi:MAG: hypothetical protein WC873_00060 [Candidatus Gracilibacteria bacterium]
MENTNQNPGAKPDSNRKKYIIAAAVAGVLIVAGLVFAPSFGLQGRLVKMNSGLNPVGLTPGIDVNTGKPGFLGKLGGLGLIDSNVEKIDGLDVATVVEPNVEQEFDKIDRAADSDVLDEVASAGETVGSSASPMLDALRALYQNLDAKLTLIANQNARIENNLNSMVNSFNNYTSQWNSWRFDGQSEESWNLFVSEWKEFLQEWGIVTQ